MLKECPEGNYCSFDETVKNTSYKEHVFVFLICIRNILGLFPHMVLLYRDRVFRLSVCLW